jgi:tetratricopeptide (TPR) repeat protein
LIGDAYAAKGQLQQAMDEYNKAGRSLPGSEPRLILLLIRMGRREEALGMLQQIERAKPGESQPSAFDLAGIYAALGDKDRAFAYLDRAFEKRIVWFLKVQPAFDPLHGDPRFTALLAKAGFTP